jgi:iron complex transport system substrate-binding protein
VPARVERVFAAGAPAAIFVYTLAPAKLLGWSRPLTPAQAAWLTREAAALPALGRLTGRGGTANVEVVLRARPDVVLDVGAVTPTFASLADRMQAQIGVPYLLLDGSLGATSRTYEALGEILGAPAQGRRLAGYAEALLADVDARVGSVPAAARPRVYSARGPRGLDTGAPGSINAESLTRLGVRNVVDGTVKPTGVATVSLEQVLAWNPDPIVTIDPGFFAAVRGDAAWRAVAAVRAGRVCLAPLEPFPWLDFPPAANRLIGLRWLDHVVYGERFPDDLRARARDFYALFYHRTPDDAKLDALLGTPAPAR